MGAKHCKPGEYEHMSPDGVKWCSKDPNPAHWPRDINSYPNHKFDLDLKFWILFCWLVLLWISAVLGYVRVRRFVQEMRGVEARVTAAIREGKIASGEKVKDTV